MRNFDLKFDLEKGDIDYTLRTRTIEGRITPKRYNLIKRYVRKYNTDNLYPYGKSRNGYAYRCGCEHDCCGCLVRTQMFTRFYHNRVIIELVHSYNY